MAVLYMDFDRRSNQMPPPKPVRNKISEIEQQAESSGMKCDTFF